MKPDDEVPAGAPVALQRRRPVAVRRKALQKFVQQPEPGAAFSRMPDLPGLLQEPHKPERPGHQRPRTTDMNSVIAMARPRTPTVVIPELPQSGVIDKLDSRAALFQPNQKMPRLTPEIADLLLRQPRLPQMLQKLRELPVNQSPFRFRRGDSFILG